MRYTKEFEAYWSYVDFNVGQLEYWQSTRIKRLAFNAWQAGRRRARRESK